MLGLALFPLSAYFFLLALFGFRRCPTVLSGSQDFMLLACGLYGIMTLGPGRLLIPLAVLGYWHLLSWVFWTMFYFLASYSVSRFYRRIVVYHCPPPVFDSIVLESGIDPAVRLDGNVLFLPGLGVRCTINGGIGGDNLILKETDRPRDRHHWTHFQRGLSSLFRNRHIPPGKTAYAWCLLALGCFFFASSLLIAEAPELFDSFLDHWL